MVEAKFDEYKKATLGDRALLDEKIAKTDGAESAARLFACELERPARGYEDAQQDRSARGVDIGDHAQRIACVGKHEGRGDRGGPDGYRADGASRSGCPAALC